MLKRTNTTSKVDKVKTEIKMMYLADNKPWIIGYSGGKDSTTVLQLVVEVLFDLKKDKIALNKKVYVISSDTLVENPLVIAKTLKSMSNLQRLNKTEGLPIFAQMIKPKSENTFLSILIGRGYPVPLQSFRWCTDRIKINPANDFIYNKVDSDGEVILLLGTRKDESISRARSMQKHEVNNSLLSLHSQIENAWTYPVICDFTTDDVWDYLIKNPSPWGDDNGELYALYAESNADGECPLVIDNETKDKQSCGNSRFGCWTCTVVTEDKSLTGFIDSGHTWLKPLLDFRNNLVINRDIQVNRNIFDKNGNLKLVDVVVKDGYAIIPAKLKRKKQTIAIDQAISYQEAYTKIINENIDEQTIIVLKDGQYKRIGRSGYTMEHRYKMLIELLEAEKQVKTHLEEYQIISELEIIAIDKLWKEYGYYKYNAIRIYKTYHPESKLVVLADNLDYALIKTLCQNNLMDNNIFIRLLNEIKENKDLKNREASIRKVSSLLSHHKLLLKEMYVDKED